ncbi:MAG: hypothetical protein R3266_10515, partial [Gemmatimonadota bacterium]|nr:hypothetical protein [Gemmatimonadota bacterium]
WLMQTIFGLVDAAAGLPGIAVLTALLHAAAAYTAYRVALELGSPRLFGLGIGLLALLLQSIHLLPRPHMITTVLAGAFLLVLLRFARSGSPWSLVPLPILTLVWVNAHPGFPIGFVILAGFIVAALLRSPEFVDGRGAVRPLVLALAACAAVSLLNPAGFGMWTHMSDLLGTEFIISMTEEFQSVDFHTGYGRLFFVALFAGPALWMTGRVRVSWLGAGLFLLFAAAALNSARNITLFTVVALPWVGLWAADALRADGRGVDRPKDGGLARRVLEKARTWDAVDRELRPVAWLLAGGLLLWLALGPASGLYRFDPERLPVDAVAFLDEMDVSGPVFNQMEWGGYLAYSRPGMPVFIDGMTNVYGVELSREYVATANGLPGWDGVLKQYDVGWTLMGRQAALNQLLALDPGWERAYEDDVAVIFRRTGTTRR